MSPHPSNRRLLLGEAMDGTQSPDKIDGVNAQHDAIGKEVFENTQGDKIVRVIEGRDEHRSVADVEIRVTRGETASIEIDR
jgi:hypothetical protein